MKTSHGTGANLDTKALGKHTHQHFIKGRETSGPMHAYWISTLLTLKESKIKLNRVFVNAMFPRTINRRVNIA